MGCKLANFVTKCNQDLELCLKLVMKDDVWWRYKGNMKFSLPKKWVFFLKCYQKQSV